MATINIPDRFKTVLVDLASLSDNAVQDLVNVLSSASCSVFGNEMSSQIARDAGQGHARVLVDALFALYVLKVNTNKSPEEIARVVALSLSRADSRGKSIGADDEQRLVDHLGRLLSVDAMDVCAKATGLQAEFGQIFADARVVTDIRPVFGVSVESPPVGTVLVHNLKIEYIERGEPKVMFFALDSQDVSSLIGILERAKTKATTLEKLLIGAGITVIGPQEKQAR